MAQNEWFHTGNLLIFPLCYCPRLCCFRSRTKGGLFFIGNLLLGKVILLFGCAAEQELVLSTYLYPVLRIVKFIFTIEKISVIANVSEVHWRKMWSQEEPRLQFFSKELIWWGYKSCLYTAYCSDLIGRVSEEKRGNTLWMKKG